MDAGGQAGRVRAGWLALFLPALVFLVFGGALGHDFVYFDDDLYVLNNPHVQNGLTWPGIRWAFTSIHDANWFPLTLVSHMADVSLFGLNPAGHHFTSLLLHALNSALLFWVLGRMTGRVAPAFFTAAVWALHPLRVESVVWVSERKDVLCAFFGLLTLLAYERYARRPSRGRYALVGLGLALGLMAKPMLVTLPFVLLLLDYWPLRRVDPILRAPGPAPLPNMAQRRREGQGLAVRKPGAGTGAPPEQDAKTWVGPWPRGPLVRRLVEKAPLFLLVVASSVLTYLVQRAGGAVQTFECYPLPVRVANAIVAYAEYLRLLFWPTNLAFFYPHPGMMPGVGHVATAAALLLLVTAVAFWKGWRNPHLPVGWFWFLGTLLPVIGLVQIGGQSHADRYTYLPHIGLLIALAWSLDRFLPARRWARAVPFLVLLPLGIAAHRQTATWRNSETLFRRALAVTQNNAVAHNNLGAWYAIKGRREEARSQLQQALAIRPRYAEAYYNLGNVQREMDRRGEAIAAYRAVLTLQPDHVRAMNNLAWLLATAPRALEAESAESLQLAQRLLGLAKTPNADGLDTLAAALAANGRFEEAAQTAQAALEKARQEKQTDLARRIELRLQTYRRGVAWRE